jgi:FkbM family methyltransferase
MKKIVFDVGANNGNTSNNFLDDSTIVIAFEPVPYLVNLLTERFKGNRNFILIPAAVSDYDGTGTFHLLDSPNDFGCSSLLELNDNLDKTWPGRQFIKSEEITVDVIRLDTFIKRKMIGHIDYFHCDAQGNDLKVLQGLGEFIHIVKEGVIETSSSKTVSLYKNQHTIEDVESFLEENEFNITRKELNDDYGNELNVYFKRRK